MATILVVDDSAMDRRIAGGFVEEQKCTAVYAENGREAMEVLEREKPDIVLTDLQMPEMNGLELVEHVREAHPSVPVILMTAYGSEAVAVAALKAGAASYVPKQTMKQDLGEALRVVLSTVEAKLERERAHHFLEHSEATFVLGYEPSAPQALISYLQDNLAQMEFCDEMGLVQVSTALTEALTNAIDHGNLELNSKLRESPDGAYRSLGNQRAKEPPYCDRRVHVNTKLTQSEATFVIRDDGPGFDPSTLPDPRDPENLLRPSGRGVMLISTFMDEVRFNETGNEITMVKRRGASSTPD